MSEGHAPHLVKISDISWKQKTITRKGKEHIRTIYNMFEKNTKHEQQWPTDEINYTKKKRKKKEPQHEKKTKYK